MKNVTLYVTILCDKHSLLLKLWGTEVGDILHLKVRDHCVFWILDKQVLASDIKFT